MGTGMGTEIERKFLVTDMPWHDQAPSMLLWQGYLSTVPDRTVRVRLHGDAATLTIKGRTHGATRAEYEYPLPIEDAREMLGTLCVQPTIEKTRYHVRHEGHTWDVDVFHGVNDGLVVAEVELSSEDEVFARPPWLGAEVTDDSAYYNSNLIAAPFSTWKRQP